MNGNLNNTMGDLTTEKDIAVLFLHLDSDYVYDLINNNIDNRVSYYPVTNNPNAVQSLSMTYKNIESQYGLDQQQCEMIAENYRNIIRLLCSRYNLSVAIADDGIDLYTAAYYMYEFLVSSYYEMMIKFFVSFIMGEKNFIYNSMNLIDARKNKDSSTIYCKKILADPKIAIISANLESVLYNMISYDITLDQIINTVYKNNPSVAVYLNSLMSSNTGLFFKEQYGYYLTSNMGPHIITDIRLRLQQECGTIDNPQFTVPVEGSAVDGQ